ncbi:NB-ARC domains-containing protein, partial [Tanacetum coccineum]
FPNLHAIQKAIAAHTGEPLTETDETLMTTYLSKRFKEFSEQKKKILVILDDVWKESKIKLEHIGLSSPLPNGVKLLLTSRDENICQQIAVDADSVLEVVRVNVLEEGEAQDFFSRIAGISEERDRDLYQIGCDIVKKCGCLPLAIKLIAATLKCQEAFVWRDTLDRLEINVLDEDVQQIIEISYNSLKQEDKAIFLLCGLFPEDSNIPIEDLTRYAWGLKLLKQVSNMGKARDRTQTSVSNLKNAYLLMDGDSRHTECVKMHDLVLAFVVATVSKGGEEGCWIIHHDDFSKLSEANNMSQSCKQISLTCKGMSEFPSEFKFPNLSLLKLMHGNESLRFPPDFYEGMKKLQVIAFEKLEYPVVPTSFQCSTNLRTLCLDECSLMLDLTCIGNLSNLEVLSFANSGITILPSTFGNLKKLRLLDVTGCYNLVIDDGVLKNMAKLEELYMIAFDKKACYLTDKNYNELAEQHFKLSVGCYYSEVKDDLEPDQVDMHLYGNSLKLVTNREELLKSKINELFKITDALYLQVNDMNTLEDVDVESPHPRHPPRNSSFYNLRSLKVTECEDLRYLFTLNVATKLSKLEYLEISRCPIMEAVIQIENNGCNIIMLSNLKYLRLAELPKLLSFSNNVNVIELPRLVELQLRGLQSCTSIYPSSASSSVSTNISRVQSFFHEEVSMMRRLSSEKVVSNTRSIILKEIWPPQFSISNLCQLRELRVEGCDSIEVLFNMDFGEIEQLRSSLRSIKVLRFRVVFHSSGQVLFNTDLGRAGKSEEQVCSSSLRSIKVYTCKSLVNLFPSNPMPLFNHLVELEVTKCASVEVIFDIDMGCVGETDKVSSSRLRSIFLWGLGKLREV